MKDLLNIWIGLGLLYLIGLLVVGGIAFASLGPVPALIVAGVVAMVIKGRMAEASKVYRENGLSRPRHPYSGNHDRRCTADVFLDRGGPLDRVPWGRCGEAQDHPIHAGFPEASTRRALTTDEPDRSVAAPLD